MPFINEVNPSIFGIQLPNGFQAIMHLEKVYLDAFLVKEPHECRACRE